MCYHLCISGIPALSINTFAAFQNLFKMLTYLQNMKLSSLAPGRWRVFIRTHVGATEAGHILVILCLHILHWQTTVSNLYLNRKHCIRHLGCRYWEPKGKPSPKVHRHCGHYINFPVNVVTLQFSSKHKTFTISRIFNERQRLPIPTSLMCKFLT